MATYNKFNAFVENVAEGVHVFGTHQLKVALTNTAPVATNRRILERLAEKRREAEFYRDLTVLLLAA